MMRGATISVEGLRVAYNGDAVLEGIDGEFAAGSLTAVLGPNGAGKSSLLAAMAGTIAPVAGRIRVSPPSRLAYLPQQSQIDRSFPIRVFDVVALGLVPRIGAWRGLDASQRRQAQSALAAVGMAGQDRRLIGELSTGQLHRVLFARILLQDAAVVLLDEPFNAIDSRTANDMIRLLQAWHREGRTIVAVLHDHDLVRQHFTRCVLLARRCVAWGETGDVLRPDNLERARRLAAAWEAPMADGRSAP